MGAKPFYRRRFLNRRGHHAGAYVLAECTIENDGDRRAIDAHVTIADCGRQVTLDFGCATKSEISNALAKARTLCEIMNGMAAALEGAAEEISS